MKNFLILLAIVALVLGAGYVYARFFYPGSTVEHTMLFREINNDLLDKYNTIGVTDCGFWYSINGMTGNSNISPERCLRRSYAECTGSKLFWMERTDAGTLFGLIRVLGSNSQTGCIVQAQTLEFKGADEPRSWGDSCAGLNDSITKTCR